MLTECHTIHLIVSNGLMGTVSLITAFSTGLKEEQPNITLDLLMSKGLRNLANRKMDIAIRFMSPSSDYLIGKEVCKMQMAIYGQTFFLSDEKEVPQWISMFEQTEIALRMDDLYNMYRMGVAIMPY